MAVEGILTTNAYYNQYKPEDPWVAPTAPELSKKVSSRTEEDKLKVPSGAAQTGKEFLTYVRNRFGIQKLRSQLSDQNLYERINNYQNGGGPILVYINNSAWDYEDKIIKGVLNNEAFANLLVM